MCMLYWWQVKFFDFVSCVLMFDYFGVLVVLLLFLLVLVLCLGLVCIGFLFGLFNMVIVVWMFWYFCVELVFLVCMCMVMVWCVGVVVVVLFVGFGVLDKFMYWFECVFFGDEIIYVIFLLYQWLVVICWKDDLCLYINGNLQFLLCDEYCYYEVFVFFVLEFVCGVWCVLVLGGGDGFVLWQILKYLQIEYVMLVDLDLCMMNLFLYVEVFVVFNQYVFSDFCVMVVNVDVV